MTRATVLRSIGLASLTASVLAVAFAAEPEAERRGRAEFMREKLSHSKNILEGLAREDFIQIKRGARALKAMKESPEWPAMSRPASSRYGFYSFEFQELVEQLEAKAVAKDIDGTTLAYVRLTMNCVNCHKELRAREK